MLARTADNLFWFARYIERADFVARIVNTTRRLVSLPSADGGSTNEWKAALAAVGSLEQYQQMSVPIEGDQVVDFLLFEPNNPSSIANCIEYGRVNARAVRTALTIETWEAINAGWLEMKKVQKRRESYKLSTEELVSFLDASMKLALDVDGSSYRTMLRNDAYWFSRLGLYVERADNTARILDVKYNVLLPEHEIVGGSLDYFQWNAILRAVSAVTSYHWIYREGVKPWLIADLLILRPEMPRSLIACYSEILRFLDAIGRAYGRQGLAQRKARLTVSRLENATMRDVFGAGLHEFLTQFIEENSQISEAIAQQYLLD
jgi:uncharacterized alpha-E superfamily protein